MIKVARISYRMFSLNVGVVLFLPLVSSAVGDSRVSVAVLPFSASIDSKEVLPQASTQESHNIERQHKVSENPARLP